MFRADAPLIVPVIGGGEVIYTGEELRQDDRAVPMQLVHMSKESRSQVFFTPYSFFKAIKWPHKGTSYTRFVTTLRRLNTASLEVYSTLVDREGSVRGSSLTSLTARKRMAHPGLCAFSATE